MAAAAAADELFALGEKDFEVRPVSTATSGSLDWSAVDVLYVSSGLSDALLDPTARAAVQGWLDAGGGVVVRGAHRCGVSRVVRPAHRHPVGRTSRRQRRRRRRQRGRPR